MIKEFTRSVLRVIGVSFGKRPTWVSEMGYPSHSVIVLGDNKHVGEFLEDLRKDQK